MENAVNRSRLSVKFFDDAIGIYTDNDIEVVYWVKDEWEEDSEVVFSIANAIKLAYTDPEKLLKINKAHIEAQ